MIEVEINTGMHAELNDLLDKIRKFVCEKNGWVERKEICKTLKIPLRTQLIEDMHN